EFGPLLPLLAGSASDWRFNLVIDLNLPGVVLGAPITTALASSGSARFWNTLTVPYFCLPVWWFVGRSLDRLIAKTPLHWVTLVSMSILSCACLAFTVGILTSPAADRIDLLNILPGAIFWTIAFGFVPLARWLPVLARKPK